MVGVLLERGRKGRYLCGPFSEHTWREVADYDWRWDGAGLVPSRYRIVLPRCFRQSRGSGGKCRSDIFGRALDNTLSRRRIRIQSIHPAVCGVSGRQAVPDDSAAGDEVTRQHHRRRELVRGAKDRGVRIGSRPPASIELLAKHATQRPQSGSPLRVTLPPPYHTAPIMRGRLWLWIKAGRDPRPITHWRHHENQSTIPRRMSAHRRSVWRCIDRRGTGIDTLLPRGPGDLRQLHPHQARYVRQVLGVSGWTLQDESRGAEGGRNHSRLRHLYVGDAQRD